MTRPLAKWVMQSYAKLWQEFKGNRFEHSDASRILGSDLASVLICHLKRSGWIDAVLNPEDTRKRFYTLKDPERAIMELLDEKKKQ